MKIAQAQIKTHPDDISKNIKSHLRFTSEAAKYGADFILFPELSLTGYEALQPQHAQEAISKGAHLYVASVAKPKSRVDKAYSYFPKLAQKYRLPILMANNVGPFDDFTASGKSAAWNADGLLIGQLNEKEESLLICEYDSENKLIKTKTYLLNE